MQLRQGRGEVSVWLDQRFLGRETSVRTEPAGGSDRTLSLRSLEGVRWLEVSLRAHYR
jgi:hypothetical protein